MPEQKRDLIFLSYASENLDQVQKVYEGLIKRNLKVWFDKQDLKKGKWKPQIMKAISCCSNFVICISQAALRKVGDEPGFQDEELNRAYEIAMAQSENDFAIIPVRLEDCDRGDNRLSTYQQYDLFPNLDKGLDHLALHLGGTSLSDPTATDTRSEDQKAIDILFDKAEAAYFAGDQSKASTIWDLIIEMKPNEDRAWYNKAIISVSDFYLFEKMIKAFGDFNENKEGFYLVWCLIGENCSKLGRFEEAIIAYDKAIELKHDYYKAWYNKGAILGKLFRFEEAILAFDTVNYLKPDDHQAWYNKGMLLLHLHQYEEAITAYDKAIEIKSDDHDLWYFKGITFEKLGHQQEADEAFKKAEELEQEKKDRTD